MGTIAVRATSRSRGEAIRGVGVIKELLLFVVEVEVEIVLVVVLVDLTR